VLATATTTLATLHELPALARAGAVSYKVEPEQRRMSCSSPVHAVLTLPWLCEPLVTRLPMRIIWTPSKPNMWHKGKEEGEDGGFTVLALNRDRMLLLRNRHSFSGISRVRDLSMVFSENTILSVL
jgi:hypothetical protein